MTPIKNTSAAPTRLARRALLLAALFAFIDPTEAARRGCGSRGGAGYRKANGKCAGKRG